MLETINLERKLTHAEYDQAAPALQRRLYDLERACWQKGVPSMVLFEGWDAAGKGSCISALTQRLDPRGFKLHTINPPRTFEKAYPWLWRFWLTVPDRGEMAIFDRSWYRRVLDLRDETGLSDAEWRKSFDDISDLERTLADDGTVILKFFLHISKKEQKARFHKMEDDPLEAWRVTKAEKRNHKHYEELAEAFETTFELTDSEFAPWTIVEATSKWWARKQVFDTIIGALEQRLGPDAPPREEPEEVVQRDADLRAAMSSIDRGNGDE